MAEPLHFTPTPAQNGPSAREELDRLLETLHRHGVLRLANDLVATNTKIAEIVLDGLNRPGSVNTLQNLSVLLMALSQIEPAAFYKIAFAVKDALLQLGRYDSEEVGPQAPGVIGGYRLLNDDELWRALTPLMFALKAFAEGLDRKVDLPASDFTGKPTV